MENPYKFVFVLLAAVALCKYSKAEWNVTKAPPNNSVSCSPHDNSSSCAVAAAAAVTEESHHAWGGHFSKCPEDYKHYCIHGKCRWVKEQDAPSCWCPNGFTGARCEYIHIDWLIQDRRLIIVVCVITGLVLLIILLVFICVCPHRPKCCCKKKRRTTHKKDEIEKLHTIIPSEGRAPAPETMATNAVVDPDAPETALHHTRLSPAVHGTAPHKVSCLLQCKTTTVCGGDEKDPVVPDAEVCLADNRNATTLSCCCCCCYCSFCLTLKL
ncbi:probetacellulin isoform X2 [Engraulis encrasicolus]|uniref:probetacellulin isoform X2 n=1 Tax=Engraulis encrasicolus TaxID=184585 RepID=UPI002FD04D38